MKRRVDVCACVVALLMLATVPRLAFAQADEIQVYDGGLAPTGVFNLTLHTNFIARGATQPAYPGAVTANKSINGVPEWAYGVTRWFEAGLYLPLYSRDHATAWGLDGFKLRTLFAVPDADARRFFYGANVEYSFNAARWDSTRFTSEVRPIIGWHLDRMDVVFNPIIDTAYDGFKNLEFVPAVRLAYKASNTWQLAVEEYADFGPFSGFHAARDQAHQLYGVVDYSGAVVSLQGGVGFGLTSASDDLTFKMILSVDLNKRK